MKIINVSPAVLKVHPRNQEFFDNISGEEYERFKESIMEDGILVPLIVSPDMTVLSGHQRLRGARDVGLDTVPVTINGDVVSPDDMLRILMVSNFGRSKNDPIKQAKMIQEYERLRGVRQGSTKTKRKPGEVVITQDDVAKELGIDASTLRNLKRLLKLDPSVQELITTGCITPTAGFKVLSRLSVEDQRAVIEMMPANVRMSKYEVEKYVDKYKAIMEAKDREIAEKEARIKELDEDLEDVVNQSMMLRRENEKLKNDDIVQEREAAKIAARKSYEQLVSVKNQLRKKEEELAGVQSRLNKFISGDTNMLPAATQHMIRSLQEEVDSLNKQVCDLITEKAALEEKAYDETDVEDLLVVLDTAKMILSQVAKKKYSDNDGRVYRKALEVDAALRYLIKKKDSDGDEDEEGPKI